MKKTENKFDRFYYHYLEKDEIDFETLKNLSFTDEEIVNLVNANKLIEKNGSYIINDVKGLYDYAQSLRKRNMLVYSFYERCHELDYSNPDYIKELVILDIDLANFDTVISRLDEIKDKSFYFDKLFIMYLISNFYPVSKEWKRIIQKLTLDDLTINSSDNDIQITNEIRKLAFYKHFSGSYHRFKHYTEDRGNMNLNEVIIKKLLIVNAEEQTKFKNKLYELIHSKNYPEALILLKNTTDFRELTRVESNIFKILKDLIDLKHTGIIKPVSGIPEDGFEAIDYRDYSYALELFKSDLVNAKFQNDSNALCESLEAINQEIDKQKIVRYDESLPFELSDIKAYLNNEEFNKALYAIKNYLNTYTKNSSYKIDDVFNIVYNILKINILTNNTDYKEIIDIVSLSNSYDYRMLLLKYHGLYNNWYFEPDIALEYHYLKAIKAINRLAKEPISSKGLVETLSKRANLFYLDQEFDQKANMKMKEKPLFDELLPKVLEYGLKVIPVESTDSILRYDYLARNNPKIVSFALGARGEKMVILRTHQGTPKEQIPINETITKGDDCYNMGDYKRAIEYYNVVYTFGRSKSYIYAKLGKCYLKTDLLDVAMDYFTVARELAKLEKLPYDYSEVIESIKAKIDSNNGKNKYGNKLVKKIDI